MSISHRLWWGFLMVALNGESTFSSAMRCPVATGCPIDTLNDAAGFAQLKSLETGSNPDGGLAR
jgi:hypothetical protein